MSKHISDFSHGINRDTGEIDLDLTELEGWPVYETYSPAKCGIIRTAWVQERTFDNGSSIFEVVVTVEFLNKKHGRKNIQLWHLKDYRALLASAEQKVKTHRSKIAKLEAM
jgi:hypothetical protein